MRRVLRPLRWSLILAPMLVTGAWMRATSAQPAQARMAEPVPAPVVVQRTTTRPRAMPPRTPPPAPDPGPAPAPETDVPVETVSAPAAALEVFSGPGDVKRVALTFDDGPSVENTPRVLAALRKAEVRATFFVLGERAENTPELLSSIADDGHEIGNHGFSHTSMRSLWKSQIRDEVCRTHRAVESTTGLAPALLRPPFGRYAPSAVPLLGELGYDIVLWSVDAHDWKSEDPASVARSVVKAAKPGSIVLMHDREAITARALPLIISGLQRRGFEIVPVSELVELPTRQSKAGQPCDAPTTPDR